MNLSTSAPSSSLSSSLSSSSSSSLASTSSLPLIRTRSNARALKPPSLLTLPDSVLRRIFAILLISYYSDGRPRGYMISSVRECNRRMCAIFSSLVSPRMTKLDAQCGLLCATFSHLFRVYAHSQLKVFFNFGIVICIRSAKLILSEVHRSCPNVRVLTIRDITSHGDKSERKRRMLDMQKLTRLNHLQKLLVVGSVSFHLLKSLTQLSPFLSVLWLRHVSPSQLPLVKQYLESRTHRLTSFLLVIGNRSGCTSSILRRNPGIKQIRLEYLSDITDDSHHTQPVRTDPVTDISLHLLPNISLSLFVQREKNVAKYNSSVSPSSFYSRDLTLHDVQCFHCRASGQETSIPIDFSHHCAPSKFTSYNCVLLTESDSEKILDLAHLKHPSPTLSSVSYQLGATGYSFVPQMYPYNLTGQPSPSQRSFLSVLTHGRIDALVTLLGNMSDSNRKLLLRNLCSVFVNYSVSGYDVDEMAKIYNVVGDHPLTLTMDGISEGPPTDAEMMYVRTANCNFSNVRVLRLNQIIIHSFSRFGDLATMISRHQQLRLIHITSVDDKPEDHINFFKTMPSLLASLGQCPKLHTVQWHVSVDTFQFVVDECMQLYRQLKYTQRSITRFETENENIDCRSIRQTALEFMKVLSSRTCHMSVD